MGAQATSFWNKLHKQLPRPGGGRLFSTEHFLLPPKPYAVCTSFQASSSGGSRAHFPGHLHIIRYTGLSFSTHTAKNVVSVITTYRLRVVNLYQSTSRAYGGGRGKRIKNF